MLFKTAPRNSRFLTPLRLETIGERSWILIDNLVFYSTLYPGEFIAMRGIQTDLASIPRWAWVIFPKVGKHDKAAVIHDCGYHHSLVSGSGERIHTVKHVADNLFLEGMQTEGVNPLAAYFMHRAVVVAGDPDVHPLAANRIG